MIPQPIREWQGVDRETFREKVATLYEPAVLRGVVADWPAVRAARQSGSHAASYLVDRDQGLEIDVLRLAPAAKGRIFYTDNLAGFNFARERMTLTALVDRIAKYAGMANPPSVVAQSTLISDCIPAFAAENPLALLHPSVAPRIWIGSSVVTPAHFDESSNVACVVAGRRRFTLFPPGQIGNLYIGPLDFAPTGTPISLVSFREPDFERFPRFREALANARVAELEPGDAIYIPPLWWHHVESLAPFNVLVNYWWKGPPAVPGQIPSALDCLYHCILNFKQATPEQRAAWGAIFGYYVFDPNQDPAAHIPEANRGVLGPIGEKRAAEIRQFLVSKLKP